MDEQTIAAIDPALLDPSLGLGLILTDVHPPIDPGVNLPAFRLLAQPNPRAYNFYRYRASKPQMVRALLSLRFGMPMGAFNQNQSPDDRAQLIRSLTQLILANNIPLDATIVGGPMTADEDPAGLFEVSQTQGGVSPQAQRSDLFQNPEDYKPYGDMVALAQPFTWRLLAPSAYYHTQSGVDPDGPGAVYQCAAWDKFDVGARYASDGGSVDIRKATGKVYEKVVQGGVGDENRYANHWGGERGWECISVPRKS
jgi:hypothetical protein